MHISAVAMLVIAALAAFVCLLNCSAVVTNIHHEKQGLPLLSFKKLIVPVE